MSIQNECNTNESRVLQYVVKATEEFQGHYENVVMIDHQGHKTVPYTDLSYDQYLDSHQDCILISVPKFGELLNDYLKELVNQPAKQVDEQRYWHMLDVLPPCRWYTGGLFEYFHISERLTYNLVTYICRNDDEYFEFIDFDNKSHKSLIERIQNIKAESAQ